MHNNMDFHTSFPILANLYGIGDHINEERAHVIVDLMIRCAKNPKSLEVWGTGTCTREFLYIEDAVEGVLAMVDASPGSSINIGSGQEVSILDLAKNYSSLWTRYWCRFEFFKARWTTSKGYGCPKSTSDTRF